jgi:hypothetical protein
VVLNRIDPEVPGTAHAGARAVGERTRRSIDAITSSRTGLQVWTAPRWADPPDTLPELRRFGSEIFVG